MTEQEEILGNFLDMRIQIITNQWENVIRGGTIIVIIVNAKIMRI